MDIPAAFTEHNVIPELAGKTQKAVIEEFAGFFEKSAHITDKKKFVQTVLEREALGSTGIGHGIAFPHVSGNFVRQSAFVLGISKAGIDFSALDGKPVHIFLVLISPNKPEVHTQRSLLVYCVNLLKNKNLRQQLLAASSMKAILKIMNTKVV